MFSLDCCDREVIAWQASTDYPMGETVRDLMAESIEARFGAGVIKVPHPRPSFADGANGRPLPRARW